MKNREKLLADLVSQLKRVRSYSLEVIEVDLYDEDGNWLKKFGGLDTALDALVNDLYWDENGNWSSATTIKVS